MKKLIPVIVTLIGLSIVALMYIQSSWISNSIRIQKINYDANMYNAAETIRGDLLTKILEYRGINPNDVAYETFESRLWSIIDLIPEQEISEIIRRDLGKQGIDLSFDFCVVNRGYPTNRSPGFSRAMFENSFNYLLTADGAYHMYIYVHQPKDYLLKKSIGLIAAAILFTVVIISTFWVTIYSLLMQRKLAEVKSDFINNMTHEFKTPIATVSLAVDALGMDKVRNNPQQLDFYTNIIRDENRRMTKQVEKILEAAKIEKNELEMNLQPIDVHDILRQMTNNFQLRFNEKQGTLIMNLDARKTIINADEVHFSNILFNLMDNAVKYSIDKLKVEVSTRNDNRNHIIIRFKDYGIGMDRETQSHIFEKFYRAHTGDLHNVKGFGLGLTYVKAVVDAHKGTIKVDSAPGRGSAFTLTFNLAKDQTVPNLVDDEDIEADV